MAADKRFTYSRPAVRPLKIFAYDPMGDALTRISVDTRNEPIGPGPDGARIQVIDYDLTNRCYYTPVDLNHPSVLMQGGIDHSEGDPRFHQQMVYAVATRILEVFDRALGRPIDLASRPGKAPRPLRIFPHAFVGSNAYFVPKVGALMFGYFRASESSIDAIAPGQIIFTCLSHDIIAHELTHALIDVLSPELKDSRHIDAGALHEGLADIVVLLHRFSFEPVLRAEIRRTGGNLTHKSPFVQVAKQFAAAMGKAHGLRNAMPPGKNDQYETVLEVHARGAVLMSAIFEALFTTYRTRVEDLFLIARAQWASRRETLHPDLVNRIADEASRTALAVLTMCIRAFDYLPPIDVTFGDFLRAIVTADRELIPDDRFGQRANLIEAFRRRGIYATGARSLEEDSLIWEGPTRSIPALPETLISALTTTAQTFKRIRPEKEEHAVGSEHPSAALKRYAKKHATALHLLPGLDVEVKSLRHSFRVGPDGQLVIEIIGQLHQKDTQSDGGRRGVTIIASADGKIRYVIPNQVQPRFEIGPQREESAPAEATDLAPDPATDPATDPQQQPRFSKLQPFPERFQVPARRYRRDHPELSLTPDEIRELAHYDYSGV